MTETHLPELRTVIASLTVDDAAEAIAFYEDGLGFEVVERFEHDGQLAGAVFRRDGQTLMVTQDDWQKGRDRDKGAGVRLYLVVGGDHAALDALAETYRSRGIAFTQEPTSQSWGTRDFALRDPSGYNLTFTTDWTEGGDA